MPQSPANWASWANVAGLPHLPNTKGISADLTALSSRMLLSCTEEEQLRGASLGGDEAVVLTYSMRAHSALKQLDLSDSTITAAAAAILGSSLGSLAVPLPKLESLVLARCPAGDAVANLFWPCMPRLTSLTTLDLSDALLSPISGTSLAQVLCAGSNIKIETAKAITNGKIKTKPKTASEQEGGPCVALQTLKLDGNSLLSTGVIALAQALPQLPRLLTLQLGGNGVSCDGATALAVALAHPHCCTTTLILNKNEVAMPGAHALMECVSTRSTRSAPISLIDLTANPSLVGIAETHSLLRNPTLGCLREQTQAAGHDDECRAVVAAADEYSSFMCIRESHWLVGRVLLVVLS
eukprot:CAMPEP_0179406146 /NCGR_PEP_ID=MMETSP0799-20121207/718_1 /TAXON_ID=46947 /ORGANISM="Geminigera cryophila, Strain CCMP2564" /LENGTH=352 /DNA_ID=CAMNT_0021177149 /DNA_START=172 /DNA_END=1231 /DNA_ORIENTATION=-